MSFFIKAWLWFYWWWYKCVLASCWPHDQESVPPEFTCLDLVCSYSTSVELYKNHWIKTILTRETTSYIEINFTKYLHQLTARCDWLNNLNKLRLACYTWPDRRVKEIIYNIACVTLDLTLNQNVVILITSAKRILIIVH